MLNHAIQSRGSEGIMKTVITAHEILYFQEWIKLQIIYINHA